MEDNKDDYLKKKLHIKDRFIRRLETEKRQLEINNSSLQHRLQHVEIELGNVMNTRRAKEWTGMAANDTRDQGKQESQRGDAVPQNMAGSLFSPCFIPFPSFRAPITSLEAMKANIEPSSSHANVSNQEMENGQLLNENLEYTLEISYLKARLKSSEAARAVAERKIEVLENRLRQGELPLGRSMLGVETPSSTDQAKYLRPLCYGDHATLPVKTGSHAYQTHVVYPGKAATECSAVMSPHSTLMDCLDKILRVVLSLDDKIGRLQKT